jgi:hypothetical protein
MNKKKAISHMAAPFRGHAMVFLMFASKNEKTGFLYLQFSSEIEQT